MARTPAPRTRRRLHPRHRLFGDIVIASRQVTSNPTPSERSGRPILRALNPFRAAAALWRLARWILSTEELDSIQDDSAAAARPEAPAGSAPEGIGPRPLRDILGWLRSDAALPEPPAEAPEERPRTLRVRAFLRWLLEPDPLPELHADQETPPGPGKERMPWWKWFFSSEPLPEYPAPPAVPRRRPLRWLFSAEPLPELPAEPTRPRRRPLRWLFETESLPYLPPPDIPRTSIRRLLWPTDKLPEYSKQKPPDPSG